MENETPDRTDERMDEIIGTLLRVGVTVAAAVVFIGAVWYLVRHGLELPQYAAFHGEPSDLKSVTGAIHHAMTGHARGLIQVGLLLLIATPIARVAFSMAAFAKVKDWMYVVFTIVVLSALLFSLVTKIG